MLSEPQGSHALIKFDVHIQCLVEYETVMFNSTPADDISVHDQVPITRSGFLEVIVSTVLYRQSDVLRSVPDVGDDDCNLSRKGPLDEIVPMAVRQAHTKRKSDIATTSSLKPGV